METNEYHLLVYQMKLEGIKKVKYEKTIRGYRIRSYRPKFSSAKNLTFSGQKKLANIREKIAKMLAKTLKKIMPLKY